jgi:hypothetical protein
VEHRILNPEVGWFESPGAHQIAAKDEPIFDSVLLATRSFPYDLEIVHQAAVLRTSLISGDRVADHLRVVQASFTAVFTEFIRTRLPHHPDINLVAAVAGNSLAGALVAAVEVWGQTGCTEDVEVLVNRSIERPRAAWVSVPRCSVTTTSALRPDAGRTLLGYPPPGGEV